MLQYVLEGIGFQLLFLIIYDVFLKRETFFQWNRVYLMGTYLLSIALPWIKIEAFKTSVTKPFVVYEDYLWNVTNDLEMVVVTPETTTFEMPWQAIVLYGGMGIALLIFGYKWLQIQRLRQNGKVSYLPTFTKVIINNSELAFSFFKSIFLGDKVILQEHESIIQHELVHIRQGHSYDLLLFELFRIINWFNPLVYVYQSRISELHEFIADAQVAKTHKKEQYQLLLSQVFQTAHISFINPFFKSSLIKKRIVMLQKTKSKKVFQLKYLVLVPLVFGMLIYTSAAPESALENFTFEQDLGDAELLKKAQEAIDNEVFEFGSVNALYFNADYIKKDRIEAIILTKEEYFKNEILTRMFFGLISDSISEKQNIKAEQRIANRIPMPSTTRYENYANRKKAFQILDKNLQLSIKAYNQEVLLIDKKSKYPDEIYIFEVANAKDLTGNEVRAFNTKLDEIFEKGSAYESIIITDATYAFEVVTNQKQPISVYEHGSTTENITKKVNTYTLTVLDLGNISEGEKAQQQKLSEMVRNSPENDTLIITGLKSNTKITIAPSNKIQEVAFMEGVASLDIPFSVVEEVPIFPGCENETDKRACFQQKIGEHISKNFRYPKAAHEKGIQGKVNVLFTIDVDGTIRGFKMRGPDPLLEAEAKRIIDLLPKMKPGKQKGKAVAVPFSMPITFKLNTDAINFKAMPVNEMDEKLKPKVEKFNELVAERERLLKTGSKDTPIIKALDEQLIMLELQLKEENKIIQDYDGELPIPFSVVDEVPVFPGCENEKDKRACFQEKMFQHINQNFSYPLEAQEKDIQGKVNIIFFIAKDGSITNLKMRGPDPLLEAEAKRIIDLLPKMTPGKFRGKIVTVPFSMPITFRLNDAQDILDYAKKMSNNIFIEAYKTTNGDKTYISGKVFDKNSGLPGVNISIKGTQFGAITNFDGDFTIAVKEGQVLVFQYLELPNAVLTVTHEEKYTLMSPKQ